MSKERYNKKFKKKKSTSAQPQQKVTQTKKKKSKKPDKTRKEEYNDELQHPMWKKKRGFILSRDHHKCVMCGSEFNLNVHHLRYSKDKKAWEYPNIALVTLCKECHKKVHSDPSHPLYPKSD